MKRIFFPAILILILSTTACKDDKTDKPTDHHIGSGQPQFVKEGELLFKKADGTAITKINIEIAETEDEQEKGLMNRAFMANDRGMLFIFDRNEPRSFWMKNTIIPLDIIYVNSDMQIVHIAQNTQPYSENTIPSGRPSQYVVEVNAGFCAQYEIGDGCTVAYSRTGN